jgi:hypothetical protein
MEAWMLLQPFAEYNLRLFPATCSVQGSAKQKPGHGIARAAFQVPRQDRDGLCCITAQERAV